VIVAILTPTNKNKRKPAASLKNKTFDLASIQTYRPSIFLYLLYLVGRSTQPGTLLSDL
jgi:hypothetical protein